MKILKLEFRNINSLKGDQEIDFSKAPFTGSSLFAITGPTGSGKSTILDVISLALFNRTPRLDKISTAEINRTGAIITRNQQEAMAAVTYECRSGKFRSEWNISTARTGNLREYEMQVSHADTGEILPLKKSEVPQQNERLIGLNYNQFIKSVLLAQGEFAQFLKAKKDERGELLEKITGTGIYRQLGRAAFEQFRKVNSQIEQQQQHITQIKLKLLEPDKKKEIQSELAEKDALIIALEKTVGILKKDLETKEQIQKKMAEIKQLEKEQSSADEDLRVFIKNHGQPLQQHEKLRSYAEELREWDRLKKEIVLHRRDLEHKREAETKNKEQLEQCLRITKDFVKQEVTEENIVQQLRDFRKKVSDLEETRREKLEQYANFKTELKACLGEVKFPWKANAAEQSLFLEESKATSQQKINDLTGRLKVALDKLEEEKHRLLKRQQLVRAAQLEEVHLETLSAELLRMKTEISKISAEKKGLPEQQLELKQRIESDGKDLEILQLKREKQILLATMEEHRQKLQEGEPCHLCGSLDHPYVVHLPEREDSLDKDIREAETQLKQLNHQLSSITARLEGMETRFKEISISYKQGEENLKGRQERFDKDFGHLKESGVLSWDQVGAQLETKLIDLEECVKEQHLLKSVTTALPLQKKLTVIQAEGVEIASRLQKLYTGKRIHDDCQELQNNWLRYTQQRNFLQEGIAELSKTSDTKQKRTDELTQNLEPVKNQGFATLDEAFVCLLPELRYQELQLQRDQFKSILSKLEASLKVFRSQFHTLKAQDVEDSAEDLIEQLNVHNSQFKALKEDCEELRRLLKNDVDFHKELQQLQQEIGKREKGIKRWRLLNDLIGDSKGKKFNDFAQDLSLGQLLHLANNRLKDLSDRYRLDRPLEEEDDGLVAIDEHMGGQRRSVKTLSGGETFLLSLSLALALSDLASRNVEINSLFIDEGFGTLDPETLDQTLDTLEKLQAESQKTIGIISHVDSLKERINIQIQLKRNGQGYSELKVGDSSLWRGV